MNDPRKKKLKKYILPDIGGLTFSGFLLLLSIICIPAVGDITPLLVGLAFSLLISVTGIRGLIMWSDFLDAMESSPEFEVLLNDFENGVPMLNGLLRLGEKYIAGKQSITAFRYEDITLAYEAKLNFIGVGSVHEFKIVDRNGKHHSLCKLSEKVNREDILNVFQLMKARNNDIQFEIWRSTKRDIVKL